MILTYFGERKTVSEAQQSPLTLTSSRGALPAHSLLSLFHTREPKSAGSNAPTSFHPPQVRRELHDSMPPRPTRLLLGELTDNQRAVVMTLMTGCCAVIGFMVQNKLDERWGGLQEVRTT